MRPRQYTIKNIEFSGEAYRRDNRKIIDHRNCGMLTLPIWMIGMEFDIILIPKNEEIDKSTTEEESQA